MNKPLMGMAPDELQEAYSRQILTLVRLNVQRAEIREPALPSRALNDSIDAASRRLRLIDRVALERGIALRTPGMVVMLDALQAS